MEGDWYYISLEEVVKLIDENIIGVIGILGSIFDGSYEFIEVLNDVLEILN